MRRLSLWMKAHPIAGDSVLAALLAAIDVATYLLRYAHADRGLPPWFVGVPLILLAVAALPIRRRHPVLAAYALLIAGTPHSWFELGVASLATACIALYTLVVFVNRKQALIFVGVNLVTVAIQLPLQAQSRSELVVTVVTGAVAFAFCWVLGEFVGARHAYQVEVEAKLDLLETERDQQARMAVVAERARIARELHDVVAHAVSVMVVQADGAAYAVHTQPELAERAVRTISATGREAITELRRLLGLLREDGAHDDLAPQPGAQSIEELAVRMREIGLPVRLEVTGSLEDLPAGVGLGLYRIVQEALTNTLKHAGTTASAVVSVRRERDRIELEIVDDGAGRYRQLVTVSGGNGLIGMRERANVFGGTLRAGPHPGGGWRVHVVLPVSTA